jgi:hypothetical protein
MFVAECKTEVVLIRSLASVSRRRVEHVAGKSRVIRKLMRNYENSLGMVDEDPNRTQPPDMQRFREIESSERDRFRILHHTSRNNRLIVLCPRLEEWIIEAAREANIDMNRYNLPNDPLELHEIINIRTEKFHRLIEELNQRSNRVRALRTRLRE